MLSKREEGAIDKNVLGSKKTIEAVSVLKEQMKNRSHCLEERTFLKIENKNHN